MPVPRVAGVLKYYALSGPVLHVTKVFSFNFSLKLSPYPQPLGLWLGGWWVSVLVQGASQVVGLPCDENSGESTNPHLGSKTPHSPK